MRKTKDFFFVFTCTFVLFWLYYLCVCLESHIRSGRWTCEPYSDTPTSACRSPH